MRIGNIRYDGRVVYYRKRDILKKKSRKKKFVKLDLLTVVFQKDVS